MRKRNQTACENENALIMDAGKTVDDDDRRDAMKDRGLGTPATRARDHQSSTRDKYADPRRPGTRAGEQRLSGSIHRRGDGHRKPDIPGLTGEWEYQLAEMSRTESLKPDGRASRV